MGGTETSIVFDVSSYHRSNHRFAIASNIINLVATMVTGRATPGSARLLLLSGSGEPAPCQCRAAPARPTMRAVRAAARWNLQVDEASEDSVIDRWMAHLLHLGLGVGHWRRRNKPLLPTHHLKHGKNNDNREGDLLQCGEGFATWNLFMFEELGGNMEAFEQRLKKLPFLATLGRQADKPPGGHLSTWNCGFRTCRTFSVLCGYTKNEDGGLRTQRPDGTIGQQMTHLWMKMTHANDASQRNLELVANIYCGRLLGTSYRTHTRSGRRVSTRSGRHCHLPCKVTKMLARRAQARAAAAVGQPVGRTAHCLLRHRLGGLLCRTDWAMPVCGN